MIPRMRKVLAITLIALAARVSLGQETLVISDNTNIRIETSMGDIVVELNVNRAPETVQNFLQYVVDGHYEGLIFHRVAAGFLVQGGGYLPDLTLRPPTHEVPNESGNGLSNQRGTIAMARSNEPHSANSQFYFNLVDNPSLNPRATRWGYAVFGEVVEGMDVVDRIGSVPTGPAGEFDRDVPIAPIIIERITIVQE
jgi:cyclophilin family peptidyl-prolyl cis-trans isomerase